MLKKVLEYAGDYRKKTYQAIATMLIGVGMNILPFLFIYQIITPLIMHQQISTHYIIFRVIAIAISLILYAVFYVKGLALSHLSLIHIYTFIISSYFIFHKRNTCSTVAIKLFLALLLSIASSKVVTPRTIGRCV